MTQRGSDVNALCEYSTTVLIRAAQEGQDKRLKSLLNSGAGVNDSDSNGDTALIKASLNGHKKCLELLLETGADVNISNSEGFTGLMCAAQNGHETCVELLCQNDINEQRRWSSDLCSKGGDLDETFRDLIKSVNGYNDVVNNQVDASLMLAASSGRSKCIDLLIKAGADVNITDVNGYTPLTISVDHGHEHCVRLLIRAGADVNKPTDEKHTPLMCAASTGNESCLEMLLKAGADVNTTERCECTALMFATQKAKWQCLDLLLRAGADVNNRGSYDHLPIIVAAFYGGREGVDLLIKAGADVNTTVTEGVVELGTTALIEAAASNSLGSIKLLLCAGAFVNKKSSANINALEGHIHRRICNVKIERLLFAAGENVDEEKTISLFSTETIRTPEHLKSTPALKDQCRHKIRNILLGIDPFHHLFNRIPKLGLPSSLVKYLLFDMSLNEMDDDDDDDDDDNEDDDDDYDDNA